MVHKQEQQKILLNALLNKPSVMEYLRLFVILKNVIWSVVKILMHMVFFVITILYFIYLGRTSTINRNGKTFSFILYGDIW